VLLDILEINNLGLENLNAIFRKSMNLTVNQRVAGSGLLAAKSVRDQIMAEHPSERGGFEPSEHFKIFLS